MRVENFIPSQDSRNTRELLDSGNKIADQDFFLTFPKIIRKLSTPLFLIGQFCSPRVNTAGMLSNERTNRKLYEDLHRLDRWYRWITRHSNCVSAFCTQHRIYSASFLRSRSRSRLFFISYLRCTRSRFIFITIIVLPGLLRVLRADIIRR